METAQMKTSSNDANVAMSRARKAFLDYGKPSLSIRKREVLPRDDLDERLDAAIAAWLSAQS